MAECHGSAASVSYAAFSFSPPSTSGPRFSLRSSPPRPSHRVVSRDRACQGGGGKARRNTEDGKGGRADYSKRLRRPQRGTRGKKTSYESVAARPREVVATGEEMPLGVSSAPVDAAEAPPPPEAERDLIPDGGELCRFVECVEHERFVQKNYPMLHLRLNAGEHPEIRQVQCQDESSECPVCGLDKNTLDSIKVLKPHEVKPYLDSYNHRFTQEQVNVHLTHAGGTEDGNVAGVMRSMAVDLIGKSYALANRASLLVMNSVTTYMGKTYVVFDQSAAKVHNDAVKQFIGLASACQALDKSGSHGAKRTNDPLF